MGPAILLCPSSSAVHLWVQVSPLKKTRHQEGSISLFHGYPRCSANAHCKGDFKRRQAFLFYPASSSEKCRKPNYPFAWRRVSAAAAGDEVSVEEADVASGETPVEQSASSEPSTSIKEAPVATEEASAAAPVATEQKTQVRKTFNRSNSNANKAVVVSPAELIPGAVFPGKVTSIQTFGAFVDLGAFTNGLVHISRLSRSFVKKVEDVVQVGQDVKVEVLEVDNQANRISLMLVQESKEEAPREGEGGEKQPQRSPQQQARTPRRESSKRPPSQRQVVTTTMKKGEVASGTVKNIIRSGVFVTLPDGTDGYLPAAEVIFKGTNTNMEAQFEVGQELTVRVLRIDKGRVSLTMKKEMNFDKLNEDLNKDVVDGATNPFEIAFRRNELIASFLADRDKQKAEAEAKEEAKKEEVVNSVEEVKDSSQMVKPAVEEEEEKVANSVDGVKEEAVLTDAVNPVEEVKDAAEVETVAVKEEEENVANGVNVREDETISSEASTAVEEVKDAAVVEKPAAEEEDSVKEEAVLTEAVNPVKEVKDAAEVEKVAVKVEEEHVANGVDAREDETISSEASIAVEEVKDAAVVEKPAAEEEEEKGANGIDAAKDEAVSSETVSVVEEVKDAAEVEKVVVGKEEEKLAIGVDATKDESVSSEAVNIVEEVKDVAEVEKPAVEEQEEKVTNGADATNDKAVTSEADAENLITLV